MPALLTVALILTGLAVLVPFVWRLASRRQSLPCPSWLQWMVEAENPLTRTTRAAAILDHLEIEPGMTVLDAGCGPGRVTIPAALRVGNTGEVVALDAQAGMIDRVRQKLDEAGLCNVRLVQAGLGEGRTDRSRFDRVMLVAVLGEIPDRSAAVNEVFNALKPGGLLAVSETLFDPHYQRRRTVAALAESAGFRSRAIYGNRVAYTIVFEKPSG